MPIWDTGTPFTADPVRPVPGLGWWGTGPTGGWGPAPGTPASGTVTDNSFGARNPQLTDAISGLLTPGLVPDIARQSAEVTSGRGIAGSPAAGSTAVRMSEEDWLKRLGLANTLLSGESERTLPYQITPYQKMVLDLQREQLQAHKLSALGAIRSPRGGGGPTGGAPVSSTPFSGLSNNLGGLYGQPVSNSLFSSGPAGLGRSQPTLDDVYDWLGFGQFGTQPGDTSSGFPEFDTTNQPQSTGVDNWDWNYQAPETPPPDYGFGPYE